MHLSGCASAAAWPAGRSGGFMDGLGSFMAFDYDLGRGGPITWGSRINADARPDTDTYRNFAITDDAVIFFGQGDVMAEATGPQQISMSGTDLAALMAV